MSEHDTNIATQNQARVTLDKLHEAIHDGNWAEARAACEQLDERLATLEGGGDE